MLDSCGPVPHLHDTKTSTKDHLDAAGEALPREKDIVGVTQRLALSKRIFIKYGTRAQIVPMKTAGSRGIPEPFSSPMSMVGHGAAGLGRVPQGSFMPATSSLMENSLEGAEAGPWPTVEREGCVGIQHSTPECFLINSQFRSTHILANDISPAESSSARRTQMGCWGLVHV